MNRRVVVCGLAGLLVSPATAQTVAGTPIDETGLQGYFDVRDRRLEQGRLTFWLRGKRNSGKFLYCKVHLLSAAGAILAEATLNAGSAYVGQDRQVTVYLSQQALRDTARIVVRDPDADDDTDYLTPRPGETEEVEGIPVDTRCYDEHYRLLRKFYRPTSKTYFVVLEARRDQPIARRYYDAVFYRANGDAGSGRPEANVGGGLKQGARTVVKIPISLYQAQLPQTRQIVIEPHETPTGLVKPKPGDGAVGPGPGTSTPPQHESEAPWERADLYPLPVEPGILKRWFRPLGFCYDLTTGGLTWRLEVVQPWREPLRLEAVCYTTTGRVGERLILVGEWPVTPQRGDRCTCRLPAPTTPRLQIRRIVLTELRG